MRDLPLENPPAFEGQQGADGAVDGGVKQNFSSSRDEGRTAKRADDLSHVELPTRAE